MLLLSTGLLSLLAPVCATPVSSNSGTSLGAFYFLVNNPNGTQVVANPIGMDGTLQSPFAYDAHGLGAAGNTAPAPPGADNLFSQSSICVSGKVLLNVNAGSDSVSMFTIDQTGLLTYVNSVSSGGQFPVSVSASADSNSACVLNGGGNGSVCCFRINNDGLVPIEGSLRALNLKQTNPPNGPAGTASEILYSSNGEHVFVTVKANPKTGTEGYLNVYSIYNGILGNLSTVKTGPMSLAFGFVETPNNGLMISDAGYGFDVAELYHDTETITQTFNITGQSACCWSAYSSRTGSYYIIDTGLPKFYEVSVDDNTGQGTLLKEWESMSTLQDATVASTSSGDFMYVLHGPTQTVVMYALLGRANLTELGLYNVTEFGSAVDFIGGATYVL